MTGSGEVHADLVGATGLQPALEASERGGRAVAPDHAVLRARRAPVDDDRHPCRVGGIAPDRGIDDAVHRLRMTPHHRVVATPGGVGGELGDQRRCRLVGAGDDQQSRAAGVEAMDDARPVLITRPPRQIGEVMEEPVHERAPRMAGARVDDQPGRLVHHDDRVVDVDDPELHVALRLRSRRARDRGGIDRDLGPLGETRPARRRHRAVDPHAADLDHRDGRRPADVGDQRDDPVEALTGERRRDPLDDHQRTRPWP